MSFWIPVELGDNRYRLKAAAAACVGVPRRYAMMGGVTTGAVIYALEQASGKQLLWSSSQFVSHAPADTDFEIEVELLKEGRNITQARARLSDGERLVLVTSAALGVPTVTDETVQHVRPLSRQTPESSQEKDSGGIGVPGDILDQFERRVAYQNDDEGRESLWFRLKEGHSQNTSLLAIIGDFLPGATSLTRGSSSVDNTLRINQLPNPGEWILAETQLQGVRDRVYHGSMNMFSGEGRLLAIASQSGIRPRG